MQEIVADIGKGTWLPFPVVVARMLLAAALGAVIGFEREWRERPAGLRTHMLVCLAAAIVSVLSIEIAHSSYFDKDTVRIDPIRLIEAVTAGVAFLAAGLIVFARGEVHGLTTGAGMWLAGAIGLCCGLGFWLIAIFGAFLAVMVLGFLRVLEKKLNLKEPSGELPRDARPAEAETSAKGRIKPKP